MSKLNEEGLRIDFEMSRVNIFGMLVCLNVNIISLMVTVNIINGNRTINRSEATMSIILFLRLFEGLFKVFISNTYKSPEVSIELLPIKYKLSGWAILL